MSTYIGSSMRSVLAVVGRVVWPLRDAEVGEVRVLPDLPAVCVVWLDAHGGTTGWTPVADIGSEPCVIHTIGWLLADSVKAGHVNVAQSVNGGDVDNVIHIPDGMVVEPITYLNINGG